MDTPYRRRRGSITLGGWLQKHKRTILLIVGGLLVAVTGGQLLYPQHTGLLFARLDGEIVRGREENVLAADIQKRFDAATVKLKTVGGSTETIALKKFGASPNVDNMVDRLTNYPLKWRLVPFSILFIRPEINELDVYFDHAQLKPAAEAAAKKLTIAPADAHLAITNGRLVSTAAKPGEKVEAGAIERMLGSARFSMTTTELAVESSVTLPVHPDDEVVLVQKTAETAIGREILISGPDGEVYRPDAATIASWLILKTDKAGKISLAIDGARVEKYVDKLNEKVKVDPGVTKITLVDGKETGRDQGSGGVEIVSEELVANLKKAVMDDIADRYLVIRMRDVPSAVVNDRRYTSSQKGLRAYVDYVTTTQDVHISLVQLDGKQWTANGRASDSIPSASTYKLFVALALFDRIDKGEIKWNDSMLDTTVAGCLERMIVPSTNPCAEAWIAEFGRGNIDNMMYSLGFSRGTTFTTNGAAVRTTAADLTKYLIGLYNGTLVSGSNQATLLEKMGRQLYPYGVPTGSAGRVQDKVGFLWDYVHDAAIVRHPKGTYVVTIMTRGQSYARIAQITRELERIMYP